jgi:hypothetical protein
MYDDSRAAEPTVMVYIVKSDSALLLVLQNLEEVADLLIN